MPGGEAYLGDFSARTGGEPDVSPTPTDQKAPLPEKR
jgi:hypothetical protein